MAESFLAPADRSRKIAFIVRKAMQDHGKQVALATAMGVSESSISRMQCETLDAFASLLAHCGLKVVGADSVCVSREKAEAMGTLLNAALKKTENPAQLLWEDET
jgi:hypothetical protein